MKNKEKNIIYKIGKKNIFIIINCLIFFFILSHCNNEKTTNALSVVEIGSEVKNMKKIYLSQFTDDIIYVPLESSSDTPLSSMVFSDFSDHYILVSDMRICLLYDNKGQFLREIGKQGRGPGEYTGGITSMFLVNKRIYIRDFMGYDLIEYNLDGNFIKRHKGSFIADEKYRLEDAIIINDTMIFGNIENRTGQEEYKALIIDKLGVVKYYYKNYSVFNLESGIRSVKAPGKANIYRFGQNFFLKEFYNDTLFLIDDRYRLVPAYVFNLGMFKEPYYKRGMKWNQKDMSSYIYLSNVYQTNNFLILDCNFNKYFPAKRLSPEIIKIPGLKDYIQWYNYTGQEVLGIYCIKTKHLIFSKPTSTNNHLYTSGFYNDIDAGPKFFPAKMVNDSTMVMYIRFNHLIEHISSDDFKNNMPKYPEKKKRLVEMTDSLIKTGYDNPVLMFVTFRNKK